MFAPLAVAAGVAIIAASAFFVSAGMDRSDDRDPASPSTPAPTTPPHTTTTDTDGPPIKAEGLALDEVFAVTGYRQRLAGDRDVPTISSDAALASVNATQILGLVWVGTERVDPDAGTTGSPTTSWRLSWVVSGEPHEAGAAPPPLGISATPDPTQIVQDVAFVDAESGEVYAQFVL